jgi:hypothetical protein
MSHLHRIRTATFALSLVLLPSLGLLQAVAQGTLPLETLPVHDEDGGAAARAVAKLDYAQHESLEDEPEPPGAIVELHLELETGGLTSAHAYARLVFFDAGGESVYSTPLLERHAGPGIDPAERRPLGVRFEVPAAQLARMRSVGLVVRAKEADALPDPAAALQERLTILRDLLRKGNEVPYPSMTLYSL